MKCIGGPKHDQFYDSPSNDIFHVSYSDTKSTVLAELPIPSTIGFKIARYVREELWIDGYWCYYWVYQGG